jgi:hypothetical protein
LMNQEITAFRDRGRRSEARLGLSKIDLPRLSWEAQSSERAKSAKPTG